MCMDEEPNHRLVCLLREECSSALVIETDTFTLPFFTLDKATLPQWISFPHVVPQTCEEGKVTPAKWARQITSEASDVAQVIGEQLPLT